MSGLFTKCPCGAHFIFSSLLEEREEKLTLHCRACDKDYNLRNTREQRKHLKKEYGVMSQEDQLLELKQLSVGDVIAYKRRAVVKYEHHGVVTKIDREKGEVTVVEFQSGSVLRKGVIVRSVINFSEEIETQNAWVRRYMPLDCLPVPKVVEKAEAFATDPESQPAYNILEFNCQHLSSWCKTGIMKSEEADRVRVYYQFVLEGGIQVFSSFASPQILVAANAVKAAYPGTAVVRMNRIERSENDLLDKRIMTLSEALLANAVSLVFTPMSAVPGLIRLVVA